MVWVLPVRAAPDLTASYSPGFNPAAAIRDRLSLRGAGLAQLHRAGDRGGQRTAVRTLWNDHAVFFVFDCADRSVTSPGKEDGLDHYRIGDTVEVFLGRHGEPGYAEVHATPAGKKSVYFFDDYRARIAPPRGAARISVVAALDETGWRAVIAVPWSVFGARDEGDAWDVFFGRYDHDAAGRAPVLSSFPVQNGDKPDFHRRADYAILRLAP